MTSYLTPSSNFKEARYYAIQSASDLFGPCSNEVIATTNAWFAVGVGSKYDSSSITVDFSADTLFCFSSDVIPFRNESFNTKSYAWSFGDGKKSTLKNPTNIYGAQGKYDVKLVATNYHRRSRHRPKHRQYPAKQVLLFLLEGIRSM